MKTDGDLPTLFCNNMPYVDWQKIESGLTGSGIPDLNGCSQKIEFWVETKLVRGKKILFEPFQIAWHERRIRSGGLTFIAARHRTKTEDNLLLWEGTTARNIMREGIDAQPLIALFEGGPRLWDWKKLHKCLITRWN